MRNLDNFSRVDKFEKRRKNTKLMSILIVIGSILFIVLIGMWLFGSNSDTADEQKNEVPKEQNTGESGEDGSDKAQIDSEKPVEQDENEQTEIKKEQLESTDTNVIEAYKANWEPIGTEQSGPHTTVFDKGSQDWIEMEKAISLATELDQDDMVTIWIGNDGEQKVVGTVTNKAKTENYRVYLSWINGQGWQPTMVEVLKELKY